MCRRAVFWPVIVPPFTSEFFPILKNKLIVYADDSNLLYVVPFSGVSVAVAESLNFDLGKVSEGCDLWSMKLNASKT